MQRHIQSHGCVINLNLGQSQKLCECGSVVSEELILVRSPCRCLCLKASHDLTVNGQDTLASHASLEDVVVKDARGVIKGNKASGRRKMHTSQRMGSRHKDGHLFGSESHSSELSDNSVKRFTGTWKTVGRSWKPV
jgi:hypothetical protein